MTVLAFMAQVGVADVGDRSRWKRSSVEQLSAFWGNLNTTSKFTAAYQAPAPSLYEALFLNKKLTNPLDPAFAISAVTGVPPLKQLVDGIAPILAATKIKQTDLTILEGLTRPANGPAYIKNVLLQQEQQRSPSWNLDTERLCKERVAIQEGQIREAE